MRSIARTSYALRTTVAAAALMLFMGTALAEHIKVTLTGAEETPAVTTDATGHGTITVNKDGTVSGRIITHGIKGIAAHIHVGAPGESGPPIIFLTKSASGTSWSVPKGSKLTEEQLTSFKNGDLYVNVHSAEHKAGEIRGQIKP